MYVVRICVKKAGHSYKRRKEKRLMLSSRDQSSPMEVLGDFLKVYKRSLENSWDGPLMFFQSCASKNYFRLPFLKLSNLSYTVWAVDFKGGEMQILSYTGSQWIYNSLPSDK